MIQYDDTDELITFSTALANSRYDNTPTELEKYDYIPQCIRSAFFPQYELGKPVKSGKTYYNAFFTNLATIDFYHTYIYWGAGMQMDRQYKKQFKTYSDAEGLFQYKNGCKKYLTNDKYRYIVSPKGGLYIISDNSTDIFHNSVRASEPVQCAGILKITDGKISEINNVSGHYRPSGEQLLRTVGGLYAAGFVHPETLVQQYLAEEYFNTDARVIGTIEDLVKSDKIKIPEPWLATAEIHHAMKMRC